MSTTFPPCSNSNLVEELELKWSEMMAEGMRFFDRICQDVEDDEKREAAAKFVARKIRAASGFRKSLIFEQLTKTSMMCRIYLSHEFRSVQDSHFPRKDIFYGKSLLECSPMILQPGYCFTKVFGYNDNFNLGVPNGGQFVTEATFIKVPRCRKIEMSDSHSLFLTHGGLLYGCGMASLFRIDDEKKGAKYFETPTLIKLPTGEMVQDIVALKNGSLIVTNKFIYAIGTFSIEKVRSKDLKSISDNCQRIVLRKRERERAKIIREEYDFNYHFSVKLYVSKQHICDGKTAENGGDTLTRLDEAKICYPHNSFRKKYTETRLIAMGKTINVFVFSKQGKLLYSLASNISVTYACTLVLNGRLVDNRNVVKIFITPDGNIKMKLASGILVEGCVEFVRHENDEEKQKDSEVWSEIGFHKVVAIVDEIPGSYGVETFCCSPDGQSCIFQVGKTEEKLMHSFQNDHFLAEQKKVIQDFAEASEEIGTKVETRESTITVFKRILSYFRGKLWNIPEKSLFAIGLSMMNRLVEDFTSGYRGPIESAQYAKLRGVRWTDDNFRQYFLEVMEGNLITHFESSSDGLRNVENDLRSLAHEIPNLRLTSDVPAPLFFKYAGILTRIMEQNYLKKVVEKKKKNGNNQLLIMNGQFQSVLRTQNIGEIVCDRVRNRKLVQGEVPLDLKITVAASPHEPRYMVEITNRTIFELMYPSWAEQIEDGCFNLTDKWIHNYFFNRADHLVVEKSNGWKSSPNVARKIVRVTDEGDVLCRLKSKHPITEFVTPTTSVKDTWYLESLNGSKVPVHRLLFLLHSRFVATSKNFNSKKTEQTVFETLATTEVIERALKALLDMTTLYGKSVKEVMEVLMFYDIHNMAEAFNDAMDILFQMFNDSNIDNLYWLFEKFEKEMTPYLLKHNRLILMSASEHLPPRGFIKKFCQLLSKSSSIVRKLYSWPKPVDPVCIDPEDAMELFINLPADDDEQLLRAFAKEWSLNSMLVLRKRKLSLENGEEEAGEGPSGEKKRRMEDF